ncbi:AAA family ATPase, partial [Chloroflexota bacterium]
LRISPFRQASASKHKLRDLFKVKLGKIPRCCFVHAVCFSDVFIDISILPSGGDPEICITGNHLSEIKEKVFEAFNAFTKEDFKPLLEKDVKEIDDLLMPYCEYGISLRDRIGKAEQALFRLTENQCRLLEFITYHKRALIEGCAGSGKTIMAIKKGRELAAEGKDVLLLAHNRMIGDYLTLSVSDLDNVIACTYHKFCRDHLYKADKLPAQTEDQDYWERQLPEAFANLIKENPIKYDAVIVDEGQDFLLEYWVTIMELVKERGYFYIFYDPDQNVYGTSMDFPIEIEPFKLSDNCRNTINIFNKLKQYAKREMRISNDAPRGEKVVEYKLPNNTSRRSQLGKILYDLVNVQGIDRDRIVILGGHSISGTCLGGNPKIGNFYITENMENRPNSINYHTYMKFKGCESDAVILLDVDSNDDRWAERMPLYTTISRAKHILYILYR